MKKSLLLFSLTAPLALWLGLSGPTPAVDAERAEAPCRYDYRITDSRPHDPELFTQGLLIQNGSFYESAGRYGQSRLLSYGQTATEPAQEHRLADRYFAEGLTEFDGRLYLLTWRENTMMVFDAEDFEPLERHRYRGEGWGLTDDGERLIRSDGSDRLTFHHPENFRVLGQIAVTDRGQPLKRLNELEYIDGHIWANVWHQNRLVQIDPDSGRVVGELDLEALVREHRPSAGGAVLNGTAYDPDSGQLWVTGKLWPRLFRLKLSRPEDAAHCTPPGPAHKGAETP